MIVTAETIINVAVKAPFVSFNQTTGLSSFADQHILKDGVSNPLTTTYAEIGHGLYVATFTPTVTGLYTFFIERQIQGVYKVVVKSAYTFLQNIEDEAIGSWSWDKNTGVLTFTRQDGTTMAGFAVVDTLVTASRQRTTP
jgi:hypothetical protein